MSNTRLSGNDLDVLPESNMPSSACRNVAFVLCDNMGTGVDTIYIKSFYESQGDRMVNPWGKLGGPDQRVRCTYRTMLPAPFVHVANQMKQKPPLSVGQTL